MAWTELKSSNATNARCHHRAVRAPPIAKILAAHADGQNSEELKILEAQNVTAETHPCRYQLWLRETGPQFICGVCCGPGRKRPFRGLLEERQMPRSRSRSWRRVSLEYGMAFFGGGLG